MSGVERSGSRSPRSRAAAAFGGLPSLSALGGSAISSSHQAATGIASEVHRSVGGGTALLPPSFGPPSSRSIGGGSKLASPPALAHAGGKTAPVPSSGWALRNEDVRTLPDLHPLEQTSTFVPHCSDASLVAARLSAALRDMSVDAAYDTSKAKASCVTPEGVEFRVRLYRGRNAHAHGVIVEVQRRFGYSSSFPEEVASILDAAKGKAVVPLHLSPPSLIPESDLLDDDEEEEASPAMLLGAATQMFARRDLEDTKTLAVKALKTSSDPAKVGKEAARKAALKIIDKPELREPLLSVVADGTADRFLRADALKVLSCVGESLGSDAAPLLEDDRAVKGILRDIAKAKFDARTADLACRALLPLLKSSLPSMDGALSEGGAQIALEVARDAGERRHASLKKSAEACLTALGG